MAGDHSVPARARPQPEGPALASDPIIQPRPHQAAEGEHPVRTNGPGPISRRKQHPGPRRRLRWLAAAAATLALAGSALAAQAATSARLQPATARAGGRAAAGTSPGGAPP